MLRLLLIGRMGIINFALYDRYGRIVGNANAFVVNLKSVKIHSFRIPIVVNYMIMMLC